MLHVVEGHRRRGLGRAVFVNLLQQLERARQSAVSGAVGDAAVAAATGAALHAYVVRDNAASTALMESLGLRLSGTFSWLAFAR
jgi:GNAT superfamily N-acetyltransferase